MGWLFAVGLGLQEGRSGAVLRGGAPLALGHAASVGMVLLLTGIARAAVEPGVLRIAFASLLIGFGALRLVRPWLHPRWVGMQVGFRDLTLWSFLMSSAHGAGLMLAPVVLGLPAPAGHSAGTDALGGLTLLAVHTLAMLLVTAAVALAVYRLGVSLLRRAWLNLDLLWAFALIVAGLFTLIV